MSDFTFTFHVHALEKEMATHSSVLAWRIQWTEEPGGLPSMGLHRVRHDWSDLAVAKLCLSYKTKWEIGGCHQFFSGLSPKERGFRDFHMSQLYWAWFAPSIASLYLKVTLHSQMSTVLQGNNDLGQIGNFRKIPKMRIVNAIANPPLLAFPGLPRRLRW